MSMPHTEWASTSNVSPEGRSYSAAMAAPLIRSCWVQFGHAVLLRQPLGPLPSLGLRAVISQKTKAHYCQSRGNLHAGREED